MWAQLRKNNEAPPVPVISVKKAFEINSVKYNIFPTNLNLDQNDLINKVKEVQQLFQAKMHILFVNTHGNFQRDKEINESLEQFAHHFNFSDYTLIIRNDLYEEFGIINYAQEINADFIVMCTHGRRGIAHLFIGSIAEDVMKNVDCALWIYKFKTNQK